MIPEKLTLTYISKEYSLLLKGLALLFMVYYHLPLGSETFSLCTVQGVPLATWLVRGCNPVGLYLFISGYGLYFKYSNNGPDSRAGGENTQTLQTLLAHAGSVSAHSLLVAPGSVSRRLA